MKITKPDEDFLRFKLRITTEDLDVLARKRIQIDEKEQLLLDQFHALSEQLQNMIHNRIRSN